MRVVLWWLRLCYSITAVAVVWEWGWRALLVVPDYFLTKNSGSAPEVKVRVPKNIAESRLLLFITLCAHFDPTTHLIRIMEKWIDCHMASSSHRQDKLSQITAFLLPIYSHLLSVVGRDKEGNLSVCLLLLLLSFISSSHIATKSYYVGFDGRIYGQSCP